MRFETNMANRPRTPSPLFSLPSLAFPSGILVFARFLWCVDDDDGISISPFGCISRFRAISVNDDDDDVGDVVVWCGGLVVMR